MERKGSLATVGDKEEPLVFHTASRRAELSLTQAELAKELGISSRRLARHEQSRRLSHDAEIMCAALTRGWRLEDLVAPHILDRLEVQRRTTRGTGSHADDQATGAHRAFARQWCLVICMREQILTRALVSKQGGVRFVSRCRLRSGIDPRNVIQGWLKDFAPYQPVVEEGSSVLQIVRDLGAHPVQLSLSKVKSVLVPSTHSPTHQELYLAVLGMQPMLMRYAKTKGGVLRLTEPWRTMPLLAAGFGFVYHMSIFK